MPVQKLETRHRSFRRRFWYTAGRQHCTCEQARTSDRGAGERSGTSTMVDAKRRRDRKRELSSDVGHEVPTAPLPSTHRHRGHRVASWRAPACRPGPRGVCVFQPATHFSQTPGPSMGSSKEAARRQLQYIRRLDTPGLHDSYADRSAAISAPWKKEPPPQRGPVRRRLQQLVSVSVRDDDDCASCVVATTTASDSPDAGDSCCDGSGANRSFLQTIADA